MGNKKFLTTLVDGIKTIAPAVANYFIPGGGALVDGLLRAVTGDKDSPLEDLAEKVQQDPALYIEFQKIVMEQEAKLAEIEARKEETKSKRLESVNRTMRVEAKSEHWAQWSWRPFNGYMFGITIFSVYFMIPITNGLLSSIFESFTSIPIPSVPESIWIGWGAILGVTTWHRGKAKRAKAGEQSPGILESVINSIKK